MIPREVAAALAPNATLPAGDSFTMLELLETAGIQEACALAEGFAFAADVAETVLHLFERPYPDDGRPREAVEHARTEDARERRRYGEEASKALRAWDAAMGVGSVQGTAASHAAKAASEAAWGDVRRTNTESVLAARADATEGAEFAAEALQWAEIEKLYRRHFT